MTTALRLVAALAVGLALGGCAAFQGTRLYGSGSEALERGETARAIADLERAAELLPDASEVQNHLGLAYDAAGRPEAAQQAFERAVALDCDNEAAQQNLDFVERRRIGAAR